MIKEKDSVNIVLIGMSGAGKTLVGKYISKILNKEFIDTDDVIINITGKTIDHIFKEYGEDYFRQMEKNTIKEVSSFYNKVISTGGGVVLDKENIRMLKYNGIIFYLSASVDTLYKNLSLNIRKDDRRPLLKYSKDLMEDIIKLYNNRKNLYISSADYIVNVDGKSYESVGNEIISIFDSIYSCS
ncbi:MAG: shikimate kinase [Tissierellia bacterium]|nr:shikimate kinase [Tissierellia bacterium]